MIFNTLKYAFLVLDENFSVTIANNLNLDQQTQVLDLLRENKEGLRWTLCDIRGISPIIVQHKIHLKDNSKLYRDR